MTILFGVTWFNTGYVDPWALLIYSLNLISFVTIPPEKMRKDVIAHEKWHVKQALLTLGLIGILENLKQPVSWSSRGETLES